MNKRIIEKDAPVKLDKKTISAIKYEIVSLGIPLKCVASRYGISPEKAKELIR